MTKAKKAKLKLPKKIAGIKIPKQLRKPSGSLLAFLETAEGREIAAGALVAIAGALTGGGRIKKAAAEAGHQASQAGSTGGTIARDVVEAAVGAIADAAERGLSPLAGGQKEEGPSRGRKGALATTSLTSPMDKPGPDQKRH
ncbi:hypothetical protein JHL17_04035 [Azospirillum sp. YIM B02556]|uniref:Uncharacterized protein n=1 Tax=Azospirillum endophyticum TaxID=2800326 RepID=A0ABS1EZH5_9PROT|nr:hypothetical protein [Azospirillum endophyticum]MBK1836572.1 hypothetical protein [Azospirillum endophyticum]